ncbi:TIGR03066 family protein [Gemmata sp. G18]|uniref:TIGR03066 family protein n=1 Tax=Gemmata palustris TaxID=2822762 RepID=A0ABS5BNL5_9BACT|nr:TIGR03066 family protein [Gemmata palustris]MBP3955260.1 TIGR03066 family protein [Gemmata palustris]
MRCAVISLVALGIGSFAGAAPVPKERTEAEKVVGTWKMVLDSRGNKDTDVELDFSQGGKMVIRQRLDKDTVSVYEGTYRIVGNELPYDVKQGPRVKKETLTIKKLTADELILIDPDGLKEEFVRVKKKDEKVEPKKDDKK